MVVTLAIPILFLFIFVEYLFYRTPKMRKFNNYLPIDTLSNFATAIMSRLTKPFMVFFSIGIYTLVFQHLRLFDASEFPQELYIASLVVYFFAVDFCYYILHRVSHRVNFYWGLHIIHHHSEKYNLSVAIRQSALGGFFTFVFYLPLAVLGLPPVEFAIFNGLNLLYQFFIHTEAVRRLGFLEIFMNTPSHHRVHHGKNPKYIDKNYAGIFIIWDKWLGTFQEEEEKPDYGVTTPPPNFNPITANIHFFQILLREGKKCKTLFAKIALWFLPPEYLDKSISKEYSPFTEGYNLKFKMPPIIKFIYATIIIITFTLLLFYNKMSEEIVYPLATILIIVTDLPFSLLVNKIMQKISQKSKVAG